MYLRPSRLRRAIAIALPVVFALLALTPIPVDAARPGCETRNNNTLRKVLECMTAEGALEHLEAFQEIADANDDPFFPETRAAGTEGYADSAQYVIDTLEAAGWNVSTTESPALYIPAALRQTAPITATYETGAFTGSNNGIADGPVYPIDLALDDRDASTSGCEPEDFNGVDWSGSNDIALVQRGACFFSVKALNAQNAGAEAIIIFNQGNTPAREGLIVANASALPDGSPSNLQIPVVGASFADGVALAQAGSTAYVEVQPIEVRTDLNVIAELPGRNPDNVVMAGAHLDSVTRGPGIQDNGSGSAALIELAQVLGNHKPDNTLRFAWWASEEQGLVGSTTYVNELSQAELDRIVAYVNFDMIASPNHVYFVYDADQSSFVAPVPVPDGSIALERLFEVFYTWQGVPYEDTAFSGRSDYQAFINNGVPASGLFTGAEVLKTDEQVAIWGGVADFQYDICYHLACDNLVVSDADHDLLSQDYDLVGNVSLTSLEVNVDAVAFAVLNLAYSTEDVNGVTGREAPGTASLGIPDVDDVDGPRGTAVPDGGDEHDPTS